MPKVDITAQKQAGTNPVTKTAVEDEKHVASLAALVGKLKNLLSGSRAFTDGHHAYMARKLYPCLPANFFERKKNKCEALYELLDNSEFRNIMQSSEKLPVLNEYENTTAQTYMRNFVYDSLRLEMGIDEPDDDQLNTLRGMVDEFEKSVKNYQAPQPPLPGSAAAPAQPHLTAAGTGGLASAAAGKAPQSATTPEPKPSA